MRFRSGTLERSVKRWGPRFPSRGKVQRVTHSWKYVTLEEQSINRTTGATTEVVLVDSNDWLPNSGSGTGVKNVSLDLVLTLTWSLESTTLAFESWGFSAGIFCVDQDDTTQVLADHFAATRALWWNATARNTNEMTGSLVDGQERSINWRIRKRQRYMKLDDELRLAAAFNAGVDTVISDARLWVFGRVSWETP